MEDKYRSDIDRTIEYYEKNAEEFVTSTIHADVSEIGIASRKERV